MTMLPDKAAADLVEYIKGGRLNRRSAKIIKEFTDRYKLGSDFRNTAVFRGVGGGGHAFSKKRMLRHLVNDEPVLLQKSSYESWSLDHRIARGFAITWDENFATVLFEKKPKPNSIIAAMASPDWWDLYFDMDRLLDKLQAEYSFDIDMDDIMEDIKGFSQERELLLEPQCDKCIFKENVAWINATLDFWHKYQRLSGMPLYLSEYDDVSVPHKYYYGTYMPNEDAVELLGWGADSSKLYRHLKRRVGRTMVRV